MKFKNCLNKLDESVKTTVQPKTKEELKDIIEDTIVDQGYHCDLNFIDTSNITDMSCLFCYSKFNGDISKWNVSKVRSMTSMFYKSKFNGDISKWNVSNVRNMEDMFKFSPLEGHEPKWYFNKLIRPVV